MLLPSRVVEGSGTASLTPLGALQESAGHVRCLSGRCAVPMAEQSLSWGLALGLLSMMLRKRMMMWEGVGCRFHLAETWSWPSRVDGAVWIQVVEEPQMRQAGLRDMARAARLRHRLGCGPVGCGSMGLLGHARAQT